MLKDGMAYRNRPMLEAFHKVYEFIEIGYTDEVVYETLKVKGRVTFFGLYFNYVMRELVRSQYSLPGYIR